MSFKDPLRLSLQGDVARAAPHVRTARALAHGLLVMNGASGATTGKRRVVTPDGTEVVVSQHGNEVRADITAGGDVVEEVISLFISGDNDGLMVFDLGRKSMSESIAGLENYEVDGVSVNGRFVYMTGEGVAVRVDRIEPSAFGMAYSVDTTGASPPTGTAMVVNMDVSPDGLRAVARFDQTVNSGGGVLDGLGGLILIDTETLLAERAAIRMSYYREHAIAWTPDSEFFYTGASKATDPGDVADPAVGTSTTDYIAKHTKAGVLVDAKAVATWGFTPNTGFARSIASLAINPSGSRLYAWIETTFLDPPVPGGKLVAFDLTQSSWPQIAELPFPSTPASAVAHPEMTVNHAGNRLAIWFGAESPYSVAEVDLSDDALTLLHRTYNDNFEGSTPVNTASPTHYVQNGPKSRLGQPPDARRFFWDGSLDVFRAYRNFDEAAVYELDLSEFAPNARYRLAITKARMYKKESR